MLQALRALWSSEHATFHGKYDSFERCRLCCPSRRSSPARSTSPGRRGRTAIGEAGVERALRRIARYADGWMTNQIEPELFKSHLTRLKSLLAEEGRDPDKFKTVLYYGVCIHRDRDEAFRQAKVFLDAYYQKDFTRPGVEIWTACGPVDHCVRCIREFLDLGVEITNPRQL